MRCDMSVSDMYKVLHFGVVQKSHEWTQAHIMNIWYWLPGYVKTECTFHDDLFVYLVERVLCSKYDLTSSFTLYCAFLPLKMFPILVIMTIRVVSSWGV